MKSLPRRGTVAILGPYGFGNLGDAAIQEAVLAQLHERVPDARVVGVSMNPSDTRRRHGIETFAYHTAAHRALREAEERAANVDRTAGRRSWLHDRLQWRIERWARRWAEVRHLLYVVRVLRKIDLLLISGGGQLDDFWGGPWQHPFTLVKWTALARLLGVPVMFLSVGAGRVTDPRSCRMLRWALRLAAYRSYRDEGSLRLVREKIGFAGPDSVVPDMAFALPVGEGPRMASVPAATGLRVAIGPIPYCNPDIWPERDAGRYGIYVDRLARTSAALLERGAELTFVVGEVHHDPVVVEAVVQRLRVAVPHLMERVHAPAIESVAQLVAALRRSDLVVSSRFHGVLLSQLLGRPVLAVSYERKVRQLMVDAGLERWVVDIEEATPERMSDMMQAIESSLDDIRMALAQRVPAAVRRVTAQFDAILPSGPTPAAAGATGLEPRS